MTLETQNSDHLETGKIPVLSVHRAKTTGSGKALKRGQLVKYAANKIQAYALADTGDIYGIVLHDVSDSESRVIVAFRGSFNINSVTATGRTDSQKETLLMTTKFSDLNKQSLYFEKAQSTTEAL